MSHLDECAQDRHFASQLRNLRLYCKEHPVRQEDFDIIQLWIKRFQEVKGLEKFARNCMMMLMYEQVRETGSLGNPFTELDYLNHSMDDLLSGYDATVLDEPPVVKNVNTESNASSYGGGSSRFSQETAAQEPLPLHEFERIKQANQDLLKEIDSMHICALKTEKYYRGRNQIIAKEVEEKSVTSRSELLKENIYKSCRTAIDLLKTWPGDKGRLNFFATCLEPFLRNDLVSRLMISELDLSFEDNLNSLVFQACSRRDDNVRMLYDHILRNDKVGLKEKEAKLRQLQESINVERQRLRELSEDLIMRHQAIVTLAVTGLPLQDLGSPGISKLHANVENLEAPKIWKSYPMHSASCP
ncbi:uncharacterized protein LOC108109895 [Drosophila eugracilis]|uniref:uncharacterized protein LOC108109895 n=1 Tax=Drosophila eugracilis TaxID=29029 RepID=UPI0007E77AF1|nr:uncharacterized protein LOC108109895 [Drosophila eugracilis]